MRILGGLDEPSAEIARVERSNVKRNAEIARQALKREAKCK